MDDREQLMTDWSDAQRYLHGMSDVISPTCIFGYPHQGGLSPLAARYASASKPFL